MAETLSAQQRANLFSMSTRQNLQMIAKKSVTTPNTSIEFSLPKARLLSNIFLKVKAKVKVNLIETGKSLFGKKKPGYVTKLMTVEQLVAMSREEKEKKGVVIQELSVNKLALMAF